MTRWAVVAAVSWVSLVLLFVWAFDPYGGYISNSEWTTIGKVIVSPVLLACVFAGLFYWARRRKP